MQESRINFQPSSLPLSTVVGSIKNVSRGGWDLQPEYQRNFVWSQDFKEKLIYSLIKRYPIGNISIRNLEEVNKKLARVEIVDGQQRLTTIYNFVTGTAENNHNSFKIGNEYARKIIQEILNYMKDTPNDKDFIKLQNKLSRKGNISLKYTELPKDIKEDLSIYPISISAISNATTKQISEYFRFLQNQEALRAGEIMKSFPHTYLEKYLNSLTNKENLLSLLGYSDNRLEFDKLFYSIIGLFDGKIAFGSQDKIIKEYVFETQNNPSENANMAANNMVKNLNIISNLENYTNSFKPTKRYLKLLLLLSAFDTLSFNQNSIYLKNLYFIDKRLAKFSSVYPNAINDCFRGYEELIEKYRPFAQLSVRTHN
ncbi:MAG: DUF262 domain-containing protein, partial [Elusimicrobiota bacterium]|nr:DUF262 domain-containing protein [Elusimicrobiota bacterium]